MRTGAEFLEGIKKRNYNIYHLGKKIENPTEYPMLKWPLKVVARIHDLALDPKHSDLLTATSPITGDKVNRFLHVFGSIDDLLIRQKKMRFLITHLGSCCLMCPGLGGVNALYSTTYDMDKELGTNYHQRFMDYVKYVQENDLFLAGAMMDVKGNRSLNAFEQADPDMYLRIVEERDDGIVVRGAKAHQTGPMIADEVVVMPCDIMRDPKAKDYAVSFAIPAD
ncbi:MAG: 4-hydroxybutyryl-CoA dehydratase, partial [Proteobacteria bacterium]|nr:4-hydroxybutyryl-CoA dehydratase [Pseudomonadota bacterium]